MSIPNFPEDITKISWEQALSMVVASIAMEELALSHILNAEGEKLQYVLGTLHKNQSCCASTSEILKVNESIGSILEKVETNQVLLKGKLAQAIRANQKPTVRTNVYHGITDLCWRKGQTLPWLSGDSLEKASPLEGSATQIALPFERGALVHYSFSLEVTGGERNVSILFQQQMGKTKEIIAVEEIHVCFQETMAYISGSMVILPERCEGGRRELECILTAPCCASVKRAALTVTEI